MPYAPPTLEAVLAYAKNIDSGNEDFSIEPAYFPDPFVAQCLLQVKEGWPLDAEMIKGITGAYNEWKDEGFLTVGASHDDDALFDMPENPDALGPSDDAPSAEAGFTPQELAAQAAPGAAPVAAPAAPPAAPAEATPPAAPAEATPPAAPMPAKPTPLAAP